MEKYIKPTIKIDLFMKEDIVTVSVNSGIEDKVSDETNGNNYETVEATLLFK